MAVDLKTGDMLWAFQADENDVFMGGCNPVPSDACPQPNGPDLDISVPPVLKTLPNGKRVLIAGTKRGHVFALDPDDRGKLLYRVLASTGAPPPATAPTGRGGGGGTIVWGGAADDQARLWSLPECGTDRASIGHRRTRLELCRSARAAGATSVQLQQLFRGLCLRHPLQECFMPSLPQTESNSGNTTRPRTRRP